MHANGIWNGNLQLRQHLVALLQQCSSIVHELINNSLGRLLFVYNSSNLAHQEGASVFKGLVVNIIREVLHVVLSRNNSLGGELLDLILAVLLPVFDVFVVTDTEWAALGRFRI